MGRKSLKETRQKQIIRAFYKLAKKEGLENASIAKTADLLKINPSLVIHYFKTKEHLVYGLVEYILDRYLLIFEVPETVQTNPKKKLLAVIDNIFSQKWNTLFDDSVSYSCYSLTFRDKTIKKKYKLLLDSLRNNLEALINDCNENGSLQIKDTAAVADLVFILVDGAYYYLSLVSDKSEYEKKLSTYKKRALGLLNAATSAAS
ncbi:TetR/AcrR family transcriptional regulator [Niabella hirudinis]|uniref:TetR/AcrR family transcriptional regulator n=1 Tax=Niabella hirudinis TaxID=1285929 RepID=UPI003EB7B8E6